jgi:molecular chaperone GrpE
MSDEPVLGAGQVLAAMDYVSRMQARELEHRRATGQLLGELLDVADALQDLEGHCRDLARAGQEQATAHSITAITRRLLDVLGRAGVEPMNAAGKPLDLALHEVVAVRPDSRAEEGTVLEEVCRGYFWHSNLLRRARVIVAGPQLAPAPATNEAPT